MIGYKKFDLSMNGVRTLSDGNGTIIKNGIVQANNINANNINCDNITSNYLQQEITDLQTATFGITYNQGTDTTTIDNNVSITKKLYIGSYDVETELNDINTELNLLADTSGNFSNIQTALTGITYVSNVDATSIDNNVVIQQPKALTLNGQNVGQQIITLNNQMSSLIDASGNVILENQVNQNTNAINNLTSGNNDMTMSNLLVKNSFNCAINSTAPPSLLVDVSNNNMEVSATAYFAGQCSFDSILYMNSTTKYQNNTYSFSTITNNAQYPLPAFSSFTEIADIALFQTTINAQSNLSINFTYPLSTYIQISKRAGQPNYDLPFEIYNNVSSIIIKVYDSNDNFIANVPYTSLGTNNQTQITVNTGLYNNQFINFLNICVRVSNYVIPNSTYQSVSKTYKFRILFNTSFTIYPPNGLAWGQEIAEPVNYILFSWTTQQTFADSSPAVLAVVSTQPTYEYKAPFMTLIDTVPTKSFMNMIADYITCNYKPRFIKDWFSVSANNPYTIDLTNNSGLSYVFDHQCQFQAINTTIDASNFMPHIKILFRVDANTTDFYDITGHNMNTNFDNGFCIAWSKNLRQLRIRTGDLNVAVIYNFQSSSYISYTSGQYKVLIY